MITPSGGSINEQDLKAAIAQVAAAMGEDYGSSGKGRKSLFRRRTKKVGCWEYYNASNRMNNNNDNDNKRKTSVIRRRKQLFMKSF